MCLLLPLGIARDVVEPPAAASIGTVRLTFARAGTFLGLILAVLAAGGAPVGAHSTLVATFPALGAEVTELQVVQLTFGERLLDDDRNQIWLIDSANATIELGPALLSEDRFVLGTTVSVPLAKGDYTVRFRAASSDADGIQEGGYAFSIVSEPGSNRGAWILLTIGVLGMAVVVFLLRPSKKTR